jgi:hypothetical protein
MFYNTKEQNGRRKGGNSNKRQSLIHPLNASAHGIYGLRLGQLSGK